MQPNLPDDFDQIPRWHFAVGGLDSVQEVFELGGAIRLRRLKQFPTHEDLVDSLGPGSLTVAGAMAQYGEQVIRHELVIDAERFQERPDRIFPTAGAILAGLRIRTQAEIVCPAVCEVSWAVLEEYGPPVGCRAYHMERGMSYHSAGKPKMLLADDLDWVRDNLATIVRLTESDDFQTAVEALCTYMLASNDRMKVAQLWAGIEAIFGIEYDRDQKDGAVGIVGYEINFNRYFYRYQPPRPLEQIEADINSVERDVLKLLKEVAG